MDFYNMDGLRPDQQDCIKKVVDELQLTQHKVEVLEDDFNGDNYIGKITRFVVCGQDKHGNLIKKHLISKTAPSSVHVREKVTIRQYYCTEIYAYKTLLPAMREIHQQYLYPDHEIFDFIKFHGAVDTDRYEFILMEDVTTQGYQMYAGKKPLDLAHMKVALRSIAYFHSLSFALKTHRPDVYEEVAQRTEGTMGFSPLVNIFITNIIENATTYIKNAEFKEKFQKFASYNAALKCTDPNKCHPYNVLCHGDFWQNNILFRYQDGVPTSVRLVDWQWMKHCSPIIDISQLIFSATEQSFRKDHYHELLNIYYDTLRASLTQLGCDVNQCYPEHVYRQQLKDILPYGMIFSMMTLTFLMRQDEDLVDLENEIKTLVETSNYNFKYKNESSAANFTARVEGVIQDCIDLGIL